MIAQLTTLALVLTAATALLAAVARLVLWRWDTRTVAEANRKLRLPVPSMALQDPKRIVQRILDSEALAAAIGQYHRETGLDPGQLRKLCRRYATELVPNFSPIFYFRVGYWAARALLLLQYSVRSVQLDTAALDAIAAGSTVVVVANHRSNMDVLLLNYLASRYSTLTHAAGEWARVWPLNLIMRMAGNYVVERDARSPLYRCVLKQYIHIAVREGVHLAVFPEGSLSRDGRLQAPRFGLLSYIVRHGQPNLDGRIVFIPVGINYDAVPEEIPLIAHQGRDFTQEGRAYVLRSSVLFIGRILWLCLVPRASKLGLACARFGRPLRLETWRSEHGVPDNQVLSPEKVNELGTDLMAACAQLIPALPSHLLATVLVQDPERAWDRADLDQRVKNLSASLTDLGATRVLSKCEQTEQCAPLQCFERRGLVQRGADGRVKADPSRLAQLRYLANSIAHRLPAHAAR